MKKAAWNPWIWTAVIAATALLANCGGGAPAPSEQSEETEAQLVERARCIHERVITLDTHDGTSAQVQSLELSDLDPGTYFWRVSALDAEGYESAWSHTAHFIYPMNLR